MPFFSQFPKKEVKINFLKTDDNGTLSLDLQDKTITDIFRHVDVTTLNSENYTSYTYYDVQDGERPDIISQKLYNTPDYYWTFFIVNDFLQAGFNAFPKSSIDLDRGIQQEYGKYGALLMIPEYVQTVVPPEITGVTDRIVNKMINQPGGLDLDKPFVRLVNKANNTTAKVFSWTPERLLLTVESPTSSDIVTKVTLATPTGAPILTVYNYNFANKRYEASGQPDIYFFYNTDAGAWQYIRSGAEPISLPVSVTEAEGWWSSKSWTGPSSQNTVINFLNASTTTSITSQTNVGFFTPDDSIDIEANYITDTGTRLRNPQKYIIDISSSHTADMAVQVAALNTLKANRSTLQTGTPAYNANELLITAKEEEIQALAATQLSEKTLWLDNFNKQVQSFIDPDALGTNERTYTLENLSLYEFTAYNVYKDLEFAPYSFERTSTVDGEGEIGEQINAFDALAKGGGFITRSTTWRDYEEANNEARRQIVVVKPEYIERFAEEYRDLITS